jgi:hypothetical protein
VFFSELNDEEEEGQLAERYSLLCSQSKYELLNNQ